MVVDILFYICLLVWLLGLSANFNCSCNSWCVKYTVFVFDIYTLGSSTTHFQMTPEFTTLWSCAPRSWRGDHLILTDKLRKLFGWDEMFVFGEKYHILNTVYFWRAQKSAVWQVSEWSVRWFKKKVAGPSQYRTWFLWLNFPPSLFQMFLGTSKVWIGTGYRNLFP